MNIESKIEQAKLTIALDVRHPFAFLALGPAIDFGDAHEITINWLPRASETLRPPTPVGRDDDRSVRHNRYRAQMVSREIAVYADAQGLQLEQPYRSDPADLAHMAWLYIRETVPDALEPFLVELFRRYWSLCLNANDPDETSKLVVEFGGDGQEFLAWAASSGPLAIEHVATSLEEVGLFGVPAYLACGQVFQGRQHLPMIEWLLAAESGPIPI